MVYFKVHNNYSSEDFDDDLRNVLRRAGTKAEKIVFILDESNVMDAGFLERMNTLLANGEVCTLHFVLRVKENELTGCSIICVHNRES